MKSELEKRRLYSQAMALLARAESLLKAAREKHEKRTRKQAA